MKKEIIILVPSFIVGLIFALLYNRMPTGHGQYAWVPPRVAVGVFVWGVWYFTIYANMKMISKTKSLRVAVACLSTGLAFALSIWAVFFPMESLYWA